jgi:carboxylesterase type B
MLFSAIHKKLLVFFIVINSMKFIDCKTVLVKLSNKSQLIGYELEIFNNKIGIFLGIPYAKPPIGDLRFKKPVPIASWLHVYNATNLPPPCLNYNNGSPEEMPWNSLKETSEDCLYLNIWTPSLSGDSNGNPFSVMVWIYGGGFQTGSIDLDLYDGQALSAIGNVVVVTLNYRVGVLGLFYSGTEDAPGNIALHDQNLALKWVKTNIGSFGGDPQSITLFGESAGSISIGIHLVSPLSQTLFKRAIMQSGSPYHNIGGVEPSLALQMSKLISKDANCLSANNEIDFDCLRSLSRDQIKHIYEDIYSKGIKYLNIP